MCHEKERLCIAIGCHAVVSQGILSCLSGEKNKCMAMRDGYKERMTKHGRRCCIRCPTFCSCTYPIAFPPPYLNSMTCFLKHDKSDSFAGLPLVGDGAGATGASRRGNGKRSDGEGDTADELGLLGVRGVDAAAVSVAKLLDAAQRLRERVTGRDGVHGREATEAKDEGGEPADADPATWALEKHVRRQRTVLWAVKVTCDLNHLLF